MSYKNHLLFLAALIALSGCSEESEKIPTAQIEEFKSDLTGYKVPEGVVISKDFRPFWKEHIVVGYPEKPHLEIPAKLVALDQDESCNLKKPGDNELVHKIDISGSMKDTAVNSWSHSNIDEATQKFIDRYKRNGEAAALEGANFGNPLQLVNLYVTENTASNHLMLSSEYNVLWNIQTAYGVKISSITLLGRGVAAVANVVGNVNIQSMTAEKALKCEAVFWRKPDQTWAVVQNANDDAAENEKIIDKHHSNYARYNQWYLENYGVSAGDEALKSHQVSNILIGPVPKDPKARLTYKSLNGSTVYLTGGRSAIIADKDKFKEITRNAILTNVKKQVGDDLSVLKAGS